MYQESQAYRPEIISSEQEEQKLRRTQEAVPSLRRTTGESTISQLNSLNGQHNLS